MSFTGKSIISIDQFDLGSIEELFEMADRMEPIVQREKVTRVLEGAVLGNLFFEASTRTRISFGAAFSRLGGSVCETTGFTFSSISKGESLYDTSRVISGYVDAVVMRHPEEGSVAKFAEATNIPLINGGDGIGEHPTQALLDLFTISKEFRRLGKTIDKCAILILGDLKNGRTVHSLVKVLSLYKNIRFYFVSPKNLGLSIDLLNIIAEREHDCEVHTDFDFDTSQIDVVYATRIQRERFHEGEQIEGYSDTFRVNKNIVEERFGKDLVIMHPLPRDSREGAYDLSEDLNLDPRLAVFRQTDNGVQIRMALFALIMGVGDQIAGSIKDATWWSPKYIGPNDAGFTRIG